MMTAMTTNVRRAAIACTLLLGCMGATVVPHQVAADQLTVRAFHATTSGTMPYDTIEIWCQSDASCTPPPVVGIFPSGQAVIDFFYSTNYQTQSVLDMQDIEGHFSIVIRTSGGKVFLRCTLSGYGSPSCDNVHAHGADRVYEGNGMIQLWAPQQPQDMQPSAFPNDTYQVQFVIDGMVAARTSFRVGPKGANPTLPSHAKVLSFYPISALSAADAQQGQIAVPPHLAAFPSASTTLYFYLRYRNFNPATPVTLLITQPTQHLPLAEVGPFTLRQASGAGLISVPAPAGNGYYEGGTYTAALLAGTPGTVMATITFQVSY